jgi:hypothetical protein
MVFNVTFNNIAAISWQSVLLEEETRRKPPTCRKSWEIFTLKKKYCQCNLLMQEKSSCENFLEAFWPWLYYTCINDCIIFVLTTTYTITVCPQVFSSGGTCTLLPSFLGVHTNFWGCYVPSNSSFGGTKEMNCIFSTHGRAPCCFFVNIRPKKKYVCLLSHVKKI